MKVEELYEKLKKINEPRGYYFNRDQERTFFLLEGLLQNKERYGYMACPCRLAVGDKRADKDIICPCDYRRPDVEEYGTCFCNLYVSKEWNERSGTVESIPERRPPERQPFLT